MVRSGSFQRIAVVLTIFLACATTLAETGKDWTQANALAPGGDAKANPQAKAAVQKFMAGPSVFIQNAGQWPDDLIRFALDLSQANVGLTDQGPRIQPGRRNAL